MGLSGLAWSGFVLSHMIGNLLIFVSAESYNKYGHALVSNPLIYIAEGGLVLALLLHLIFGMQLTKENKQARPEGYHAESSGAKAASPAQKSMIYTGSLILISIILHIITFKYGTHYTVDYGHGDIRDLHRLIIEVFSIRGYVFGYLVCLVLLGVHLSHGLQASFQSLGFRHPRYTPTIKIIGWVYSIVVAAGFISQPLYVYFMR